jgi:3-oxoadipate enol-lactonase
MKNKINYIDTGSGEPLILIPGLGQTAKSWVLQEELSDTYRLIIVDLLYRDKNITLYNFAKDITELMDELNIGSAHILGLSLGGFVAQEIYKQDKNKVKSLILANTACCSIPFITYCRIKERENLLNKLTNEKYIKSLINDCVYQKDEKKLQIAFDSFHINRDTYFKAAKSVMFANYIWMLPFIKVPTLIIGSEYDKTTPLCASQFMNTWISNSKLVTLKTGHLSNIEDPLGFNNAVRKFLEEMTHV